MRGRACKGQLLGNTPLLLFQPSSLAFLLLYKLLHQLARVLPRTADSKRKSFSAKDVLPCRCMQPPKMAGFHLGVAPTQTGGVTQVLKSMCPLPGANHFGIRFFEPQPLGFPLKSQHGEKRHTLITTDPLPLTPATCLHGQPPISCSPPPNPPPLTHASREVQT